MLFFRIFTKYTYLALYGDFLMFVEKRTDKRDVPFKEMPIQMLNLNSLKPHEALVRQELEAFKKSVTELGIFYMPALVTSEDYVIIDGHHRWAGLKELGAKRIPCIVLEYLTNDSIQLDSWYPIVLGDPNIILRLPTSDFLVKIEKLSSKTEVINEVRHGKGEFGLLCQDGNNYLVFADFQKITDIIQNSDELQLGYIDTAESAIKEIEQKRADFSLIRKPLTKKKVVETAKIGKIFPPKSTRHILPFRYQDIEVKYEDLF